MDLGINFRGPALGQALETLGSIRCFEMGGCPGLRVVGWFDSVQDRCEDGGVLGRKEQKNRRKREDRVETAIDKKTRVKY